jgi:hypothetical protein
MHTEQPGVLRKEFLPSAKKKEKARDVLAAAACSGDDELDPEEE